jgi:non-ribosomal peptide synthetase component E (peptide arylation enzyme)
LHGHEMISEAAVVAMPHARLGEGVCVFLVMRDSATLEMPELQVFLQATGLAKQKWPQRIEMTEALQKTASGKVKKDVLRKQVAVLIEAEA